MKKPPLNRMYGVMFGFLTRKNPKTPLEAKTSLKESFSGKVAETDLPKLDKLAEEWWRRHKTRAQKRARVTKTRKNLDRKFEAAKTLLGLVASEDHLARILEQVETLGGPKNALKILAFFGKRG